MGLRKKKKMKEKTPKDSHHSVIREKTPDQENSQYIRQKTPNSSPNKKEFEIPPPRPNLTYNIPKEEPFIPSREGLVSKKQRKEGFASITPPIIPKGGNLVKDRMKNRSLPPQIHEKSPNATFSKTYPTALGSTKSKTKSDSNTPPPALETNKSIPKREVRGLPPTIKSKKIKNHQPPQKIKVKAPGANKKPPTTSTRSKIPKKIVNKRPPPSVKSKTPTKNSKPPPTYQKNIPKTRIKRKHPK
jgi:hypothetical protein